MSSVPVPAAPGWRAKAALAGVVLLVGGVVAYRVWGASFQWGLFLGTLYHLNWIWLFVSILLTLLTYWARALRWDVMLRPLGRTVPLEKLISDTAIGFTAIVLLGRAGEAVRPYLISVSAGVSFSSQVAAWVLERIFDLLAVLLLFGFALAFIPGRGLSLGPALRWVLGVGGYLIAGIGVACLLFLILFRNFSEAARNRILSAVSFLPPNYYSRIEKMLATFSEGMESTRDSKSLALLVSYSGVLWAIIVASYFALFRSFPSTAAFKITDVVVFLGFLAFGSLLQIPGIGGGIQVVSVLVLTEIYRLPIESAAGVAVFIWFITFVVIVPVGLLCAFHQGLNWSKIRHLPKDVAL